MRRPAAWRRCHHPDPEPEPDPNPSPKQEMFKPLLDYTKELLGKKVEKVQISKHLVNSPVVVLSADYGWTAQMEKVMKSQAFADQSKFEFMKSKRMFEINPRHPMIIELNSRIKDNAADDTTKVLWRSNYMTKTHRFPACDLTPQAMTLMTRVALLFRTPTA